MILIAKNEIEFSKFLKDEFNTGMFNLKLNELQNEKNVSKQKKKTNKRKVLVCKERNKSGMVKLYEKDNGKLIAVYEKETNTLTAENNYRFIGTRIRVLENKNHFDASETRSPRVSEVKTSSIMQTEEKVKVETPAGTPAVTASTLDHSARIQNLLDTHLKDAKKIWAILKSGEEIQIENRLFEESNTIYLGNSKSNTELTNVSAIKFRGKVYQ